MRDLMVLTSLLIAMLYVSCKSGVADDEIQTTVPDSAGMVKRGEYLVNTMGCEDCHSPKKMGPLGPEVIEELHLSGFRSGTTTPPFNQSTVDNGWSLFSPDFTSAVGPWGQSFAANLTSDPTGIGNWTEENFMRAIREGKFKGLSGGRDLLPPMPWFVYKRLTDDDLKSIFAYLKTTRPVHNIVPAPISPDELIATK